LVHIFFKTRIRPYKPIPDKAEIILGEMNDMYIKVKYDHGSFIYINPKYTDYITLNNTYIFVKDVIGVKKVTSREKSYDYIFHIVVKKGNQIEEKVGMFEDLDNWLKRAVNTSIPGALNYIRDFLMAKSKPRIILKAYKTIGLAYDEDKGLFVPTYFGYDHYYSTLYGLHKQQRAFLSSDMFESLALTIKKLRESNSEIYKEAIKSLIEFFELSKDDETYHFNVLMNYCYILGMIAILPVSKYVISSYPFILNFDKGYGGTGKTTMNKIFAKIIFGNDRVPSTEIFSKSSTGSYARLRLYVSTFSFPIIIDELNKKVVEQNKDILTLLRNISSGFAESIRLIGTEKTEEFPLIAPLQISANFDLRELLDPATADRFVAFEFKTRFRETEKIDLNIISEKIEREILEKISNPEMTWAYRLFEDLAFILNEKYGIKGIRERLRYYAENLSSVSNTMKRNGYAIMLFGAELHNELMKLYGFDEKYMIDIEELIDKINQTYEEFQTYDEEFNNLMYNISHLIYYEMPKRSVSNVQLEKIKEILMNHIYENPTIKNKEYKGKYYLIDGEIINLALNENVSSKRIGSIKEELKEKLEKYNLLESDDEIIYEKGSVRIKLIDGEKTVYSPLLIKYEVFKRYIEGSDYAIKLPKLEYIRISLYKLNEECPICNKKFASKDDIRFLIDKVYHKDCIIGNRDKLYNEYKNSLLRNGERDISDFEFWRRAYRVSRRNIFKIIRGEASQIKQSEKPKESIQTTQTVQKEEVKVEEKKEEKVELTSKEEEILKELSKYVEKPIEKDINIEEFFPGLREIKDDET